MIVMCKQCRAMVDVPEGQDAHLALRCQCCTIDHHHGEAANACAADTSHDCWAGPDSGARPDNCGVCRPLVFLGNATFVIDPAGSPA